MPTRLRSMPWRLRTSKGWLSDAPRAQAASGGALNARQTLKGKTSEFFSTGSTMSKVGSGQIRFGSNSRRPASKVDRRVLPTARLHERWNSDVDEARKVVARQIVTSVKLKWHTAVALEAATGICRTEISRIKNGNLARFSLERLVWLLAIIDPELEVELCVKLIQKDRRRTRNERRTVFHETIG